MATTAHFNAIKGLHDSRAKNSAQAQARAKAALDELPEAVRRSTCIAIAQSSATFTTGTLSLKLQQMTINSLSSSVIPLSEIYAARKSGLPHIALLAEHYNAMRTHQNKDNMAQSPLLLDQTNVSRTISRVAESVKAQKKLLFQNAMYVSIFLDESTTRNMTSRPVYCGAMAINSKFDWFMTFVGETDTSGSENAQAYFDAVERVYKPFGILEKMGEVVLLLRLMDV